jgi:hypothetical protein
MDKYFNKRTEINNGIREQSRSIETKTREYSQGSIKSLEILETTQDNGLFRVSARVEVKREDFGAWVEKLAAGQTIIGEDIRNSIASGETQKKIEADKVKNARDILINSILLAHRQRQGCRARRWKDAGEKWNISYPSRSKIEFCFPSKCSGNS